MQLWSKVYLVHSIILSSKLISNCIILLVLLLFFLIMRKSFYVKYLDSVHIFTHNFNLLGSDTYLMWEPCKFISKYCAI